MKEKSRLGMEVKMLYGIGKFSVSSWRY